MIRYFTENDIGEITILGNEISPNFSKTNHLEEILEDPYTKILVYEKEGKVIGFLLYIELPDTVDIIDILVDQAYRRQNVASCLLDYMMSEIKESVKLLTLEVRKSNKKAISLYEKFGFSIVHTRKNYYKEEDAYLMGRRL